MNVFDNIRELIIDPTMNLYEHQFYFVNIDKLELRCTNNRKYYYSTITTNDQFDTCKTFVY